MMLKRIVFPIVIAVTLYPTTAKSDLQGKMNELFGTMSSVSRPGVFESQTRGVFTGGNITTKAKIMDVDLISATAPSFEAGCGGIDMYAGSFSFINKDQFVQLARSVAANAQGYAFKLAFSQMCQSCERVIETLQKAISNLNRLNLNSCQLAKGIVTDTLGSAIKQMNNDESLIASEGGFADNFKSFFPDDGNSPSSNAETTNKSRVDKEIKGNITWRQLVEQNVVSWFGENDPAFAEAIMSIVGTVIVGDLKPDQTGQGNGREMKVIHGNQISVEDLMNGGTVDIYSCETYNADGCLMPDGEAHKHQVILKGMSEMVMDKLLGTDNTVGILTKAEMQNQNVDLTDSEKAFLSGMTGHIGAMLMQLTKYGNVGAQSLATRAAPYVALDMIENLIDGVFKSALLSGQMSFTAMQKENHKTINDAYSVAKSQIETMRNKTGTYNDVVFQYRTLMEMVRKRPVGIPNVSSDVAAKQPE